MLGQVPVQRRLCSIFVKEVGSQDIHECSRGLTGSQRTPGIWGITNLAIKTSDIACNLVDTKEFKMQIEELLQNNLIKPSFSSHRSATFFVRNHSEDKQGKARMVINYKILNDNMYDDAYKIPNKDSLINYIQGCRYFSQLDVREDFGK